MGAFNGTGTFVRSYSWAQDAANGIDISSTRSDTEDNGFADGLTNCLTRDGQAPPTANIAWGGYNLSGVGALSGASFSFTGTGTVGGAFGVTGNMTVGGTFGVTGTAIFNGTALAYTPNSGGTTGGVRIAGNATSGNSILQFTDSSVSTEWGALVLTSAGIFTFNKGASFAGDVNMNSHAVTNMFNGSSVQDGSGIARFVGYRNLPLTASSAGRTLALTDVGMCIPATGAINIPLNASVAFAVGDIVAVYNNSGSNISITATGGVTLRLGGSASTGTRTLAQRGLVTLLKVATDEWVALNGGIS